MLDQVLPGIHPTHGRNQVKAELPLAQPRVECCKIKGGKGVERR